MNVTETDMCFAEPKCKFLNHKHNEVSSFYGLLKIHKSVITESAINTPNSEIIQIIEPNDLNLSGPKCPTRKLRQLIDILLKPFLKHIKSFIRDSSNFSIKCSKDLAEDSEIVTPDVISLRIWP